MGTGVVVLLAVGGLVTYLVSGASGQPSAGGSGAAPGQRASGGPAAARSVTPSPAAAVKVLSAITTGLVDFGPYDDGDSIVNDTDDHPLMLRVSGGLAFVPIPPADLASGVPLWTADQMSDGTDIFIYIPTGECLTALPGSGAGGKGQLMPGLSHCDLGKAQRWWPVNTTTVVGQTFSQFAAWNRGDCLTAGQPGAPAELRACGPARGKAALPQEIAFFWSG